MYIQVRSDINNRPNYNNEANLINIMTFFKWKVKKYEGKGQSVYI